MSESEYQQDNVPKFGAANTFVEQNNINKKLSNIDNVFFNIIVPPLFN